MLSKGHAMTMMTRERPFTWMKNGQLDLRSVRSNRKKAAKSSTSGSIWLCLQQRKLYVQCDAVLLFDFATRVTTLMAAVFVNIKKSEQTSSLVCQDVNIIIQTIFMTFDKHINDRSSERASREKMCHYISSGISFFLNKTSIVVAAE